MESSLYCLKVEKTVHCLLFQATPYRTRAVHPMMRTTPTGKIVGGDEAVPHSAPHQVALTINGGSFCGGSIIGKSKLLNSNEP